MGISLKGAVGIQYQEQFVKCCDQSPHGLRRAGKLPTRRQDQSPMDASVGEIVGMQAEKIVDILRDDSAAGGDRPGQHLFIRLLPKRGQLRHCDDIVAAKPQLPGQHRGKVFVQEELHSTTAWRRRQAASARSATAVLRAIQPSISARLSA